MRNAILLSVVILLSTACLAGEQEKKLGVTFDLTYMSKYMSKGVESYGRQGGLFKTIDFDFYGTGFGTKIIHRNATSSGYVNSQRLDYRPYFKSILFDGAPHATKYNISVGYEHYTGHPRKLANTTWEWIFAFSWPNLLPGKLVPSYVAHYEYPAGFQPGIQGPYRLGPPIYSGLRSRLGRNSCTAAPIVGDCIQRRPRWAGARLVVRHIRCFNKG